MALGTGVLVVKFPKGQGGRRGYVEVQKEQN